MALSDEDISVLQSGLDGWLDAERVLSAGNTNEYLDDFEKNRAEASQPGDFGDPSSHFTIITKGLAHQDRFRRGNPFMDAFEQYPEEDRAAGRLLYAGMMRLSGIARLEAFALAETAAGYLGLRQQLARVVIGEFVSNQRLTNGHSGFDMVYEAAAQNITDHQLLMWTVQRHFQGESSATQRIKEKARLSRLSCLRFVICTVLEAASYRDDEIARVPIFEPIPINEDPRIIYPFTPSFWQTWSPPLDSRS